VRLHRDRKIQLLGKVPLFAACSKRELGQIAQLADQVEIREGKELIRENERGRQFFVLVEGGADVRRKGRKINAMKKGDFFGEIALVSDRPTTASVTTTSPVSVLVLTVSAFRRLLRESSSVQGKVLQALAERVPAD
jgi:CRP/FNR family transcriptional regulator, cyclic AMP receptor protein